MSPATPRPDGLPARQARSTALFQLANEVPAEILARMLGIHISVAVNWQRVSSGDWTNYAAEVSKGSHGSVTFFAEIDAEPPGTESGHVVHGTYPQGGQPWTATLLEGQQASL